MSRETKVKELVPIKGGDLKWMVQTLTTNCHLWDREPIDQEKPIKFFKKGSSRNVSFRFNVISADQEQQPKQDLRVSFEQSQKLFQQGNKLSPMSGKQCSIY